MGRHYVDSLYSGELLVAGVAVQRRTQSMVRLRLLRSLVGSLLELGLGPVVELGSVLELGLGSIVGLGPVMGLGSRLGSRLGCASSSSRT